MFEGVGEAKGSCGEVTLGEGCPKFVRRARVHILGCSENGSLLSNLSGL